jgi:hypothetical protein
MLTGRPPGARNCPVTAKDFPSRRRPPSRKRLHGAAARVAEALHAALDARAGRPPRIARLKGLDMAAFARAIARPATPVRDHLLRAIASEYREMPGMRLTLGQFGRLWSLDPSQCKEVVRELIARGDLSEDEEGRIGGRCDVL